MPITSKPRWSELAFSDDEDEQPWKKHRSNETLSNSPPLHADSYIATPSQSFDGYLTDQFGSAVTLSNNGVQPSHGSLASNSSAHRQSNVGGDITDLQRGTTQAWAPESESSNLQYSQHPPGVFQSTLFWYPEGCHQQSSASVVGLVPNSHTPVAAATCIAGGVVDKEWPHRHEKRKRIVSEIKASPKHNYDAISSLKSRGLLTLEGPGTPDAYDSGMSKRKWEEKVKHWKDFLKHMEPFL
jgi:hypothetical protein